VAELYDIDIDIDIVVVVVVVVVLLPAGSVRSDGQTLIDGLMEI